MTEAVATIKGRTLDARYTLLDKLGAGGQGEVWRAHDGIRGIDIALKVLNPTAHQAEAWSALEHEYAIASRLDHPSILKVFPPERSGDAMILPMELASGGDLRRLRGAGFLEIIPVLLEIAQALEHAHERGVIHRDLKPGNVLFDARGRARLADFGVAETAVTAADAQASGSATTATRDTNRHGFSPFTASPAQLRGDPPTTADDIYGLGALAYELLSGYPPYYPHFDKKRAMEERVPTLVPTRQIPPLLGALVMHMLAKDPKRRPRTMREVIDELDAALNDTLTFDFENVSPPVPTASISTAASQAESSQSSPDAGNAQAARATATNTPDARANQVVWTRESQDRRATSDRRGRRREDLTPADDPISNGSPGPSDSPVANRRPRDSDGAPASSGAGVRSPAPGATTGLLANGRLGSSDEPATSSGAGERSRPTPAAAASGTTSNGGQASGGSHAPGSGHASNSDHAPSGSYGPSGSHAPSAPGPAPTGGPAASAPNPPAGNTRSPRRSGAEALARIDAALERAAVESAAQPKPTPTHPTPLTPAEAAAIVAAARAASSKPTSQSATNQSTGSPPWANQSSAGLSAFAPPAAPNATTAAPKSAASAQTSAPSTPSKPKWPREGNSTAASSAYPGPPHAKTTAPMSAADQTQPIPSQARSPGTSSTTPAASRTGTAQSAPWHATPGQPATTHWATEQTLPWPSSQPTSSHAPAAGHSSAAPPHAVSAQPRPSHTPVAGHSTVARPTPGTNPSAQPPPGYAASAQQSAGYAPYAQPTAGHPASAQPTPWPAPPGQPTPGHAPYAAQPTPGHPAPAHPAGGHTASSAHPLWSRSPAAPSPAQPPAAHAAGMQPAAHPAAVQRGTYANPVHAGPMHATWGDIPLDGLPKVARLEPIRARRWPWVFMGLLAGGAAAVYFWLPRFDTQALPPEVAAVVAPLKAALTPDSSSTPTTPVVPSSAASGASPEDTTAPSAIGSSATARSGTAATQYATGTRAPRAIASTPTNASTPAASAGDEQRLREMRQTFDTRLAALEARGAGAWGGREFATAKMRAAESVGAYDAGNPRVAQERLTAAMKLLDTVESRAPQALSTQVAAGEKALGAGQQEVAGQAFDLARRINPTDRRASDGLRRAQNLNALLPLLADAQNAEAAHDYARAAQDYSQALFLDPGNATARAGQARANAAFGDDNYAKAVGSGFAALGAGRLDEAHDAFVKSRALKPNGAEASEGLRRVGAALTARGFASMRQRAVGLEAQERWEEAERVYEDVLAADASLAFAQEGKARTISRADLSGRLQQLLDRPDRLAAPGVREDARALLETARAQSPQGPVIRSQIARLEILLPGFDKPVRLSLLSDNSTQVVISSIGSFGSFARRDIELRPGKYTVVGTRYGFRDVRREITVAPGQDTQTIKVTCSDPI